MIMNKNTLNDLDITSNDLETLLVEKDELTELDQLKIEYLERVNTERKRAMRCFKLKNQDDCLKFIDIIIDIGEHAYDIDLLKSAHSLKALICIFFDDY